MIRRKCVIAAIFTGAVLLCSCGGKQALAPETEQARALDTDTITETTVMDNDITETFSNITAEESQMPETADTEPAEADMEMMDFETFAAQEGAESINLVVWNEMTGVQEVIPSFTESNEIYEMQPGDRLAINTECSNGFLINIKISHTQADGNSQTESLDGDWLGEGKKVIKKYVELYLEDGTTKIGPVMQGQVTTGLSGVWMVRKPNE